MDSPGDNPTEMEAAPAQPQTSLQAEENNINSSGMYNSLYEYMYGIQVCITVYAFEICELSFKVFWEGSLRLLLTKHN